MLLLDKGKSRSSGDRRKMKTPSHDDEYRVHPSHNKSKMKGGHHHKNEQSQRRKSDRSLGANSMKHLTVTNADDDTNASCDGDSVLKTTAVSFAEMTRVYEVHSLLDLPPEYIDTLWYAMEEYDIFNDQCEESAEKMESGIRLNPKKYSSHGLESWTTQGFRRQTKNRTESLYVVLDEQFAQWDDGLDDIETIAELYGARSQHAQMVAVTRGLILEREVLGFLAQAVLDSPSLFANLKWIEGSPLCEKIRSLSRSSSSSCRSSMSASTKRSSRSTLSRSRTNSKSSSERRREHGTSGVEAPKSPRSPHKKRPSSRRSLSSSPRHSHTREKDRKDVLTALLAATDSNSAGLESPSPRSPDKKRSRLRERSLSASPRDSSKRGKDRRKVGALISTT